jgi:hypothetical protein
MSTCSAARSTSLTKSLRPFSQGADAVEAADDHVAGASSGADRDVEQRMHDLE